jgi:YidC/Oxa1 family membrane protein insertase
VELKNAQFLWIKNLSLPDHAFKLPFPYPIDYVNILPLAIAIIGLVQQKVATPKSLSSEQRSMGLIFSLLMGVVFYNFSASLTLYWFIQNLLTLIYQVHVAKT